jgi:hypothetical protein
MTSDEATLNNRGQTLPSTPASNLDKTLPSTPASNLDKFWIDTMRKQTQGSTKSIEDAAKQMIVIISLLQTIYFAAVSFSNLKSALILNDPWVFLFLSPIALWLISLTLAILVFIPRRYDTNLESPTKSEKTFNDITSFKANILFYSYIVLVIGFLMLLISIFVYLYIIQVPVKPTPHSFSIGYTFLIQADPSSY